MSTFVPPLLLVRAAERLCAGLTRLCRLLTPPQLTLFNLVSADWTAQSVVAAAQLGIADALTDGPLPLNELATRVGADPAGLQRLLRLLTSQGVFRQRRDGRYALTSVGAGLRSDAEVTIRDALLFFGSPQQREHWSHLDEAVRTGAPVVATLRGMPFFEFTQRDRAFGAVFDAAMTSMSELSLRPTLAAYDFSRYRTIIDVGGGRGRLLRAILDHSPGSRGVLFDIPAVVDGVELGERCDIVAGSFFESVPEGGDAYLLKHIIHDWPDDDALRILRTVRTAMRPDATLLLIEIVLPERTRPHPGNLLDLEMLVCAGGRERTAAEYRTFLAQAGFELVTITPTAAPDTILEARRV